MIVVAVVAAILFVGYVMWIPLAPRSTPISDEITPMEMPPESQSEASTVNPNDFNRVDEISIGVAKDAAVIGDSVAVVATIAETEAAIRLQPWIDEVFLAERTGVESYTILKVDNRPVYDKKNQISIQTDSSTQYVATKIYDFDSSGASVLWAGDIDGTEFGSVSVVGQPDGTLVFRVRTESGLTVIRPSPYSPYYISYKSTKQVFFD
jgi:hypothetical protein